MHNEQTIIQNPDIIIIGAGHAGCEAALASARMGAQTLLITLNRARTAAMPCNPAVGGIAKSHVVYELDALGGEIGRNADFTGIQFRVLNTRRGPAVRATRVQCDKPAYARRMGAVIENQSYLCLLEDEVVALEISDGRVTGVRTARYGCFSAHAVVLTAGTSMNGRIFIGDQTYDGGGDNQPASIALSAQLREIGLTTARLKTGTPPRIDPNSIDFTATSAQSGLKTPLFFSWQATRMFHVEHTDPTMFHVEHSNLMPWSPGSEQLDCYAVHTTEQTHRIIRENLTKSALYGGAIQGTGVRYCPSIEDKIVKFADNPSHHIMLEPEERKTIQYYPNGLSNSLPVDVQQQMVHSVPGLAQARILVPGYAIEYDFYDPRQLDHTLQCQNLQNLFIAGQLNGTTGYEEAAALGFMAGVNAVRRARELDPLIFGRGDAYIGVLIDDLVTKGTDEPYRLFTSRAEHRLLLRQDNARFRLCDAAQTLGIVENEFLAETAEFEALLASEISRLTTTRSRGRTLMDDLCAKKCVYASLVDPASLPEPVIEQVEIAARYRGYIEREQAAIRQAQREEGMRIPDSFDYASITALRYEAREKLTRVRPATLAQAARIPGVNPSDIAILSVHLRRKASL